MIKSIIQQYNEQKTGRVIEIMGKLLSPKEISQQLFELSLSMSNNENVKLLDLIEFDVPNIGNSLDYILPNLPNLELMEYFFLVFELRFESTDFQKEWIISCKDVPSVKRFMVLNYSGPRKSFPDFNLLKRFSQPSFDGCILSENTLFSFLENLSYFTQLKNVTIQKSVIKKLNTTEYTKKLCSCLSTLNNLEILMLDIGVEKLSLIEEKELYEKVEKHPNLVYFQATENSGFFYSLLQNKLKTYLKESLDLLYDTPKELNETKLIFLGDGRSGKTSLVRNLCGYRFLPIIPSTVLLDLNFILDIFNWKALTRYELTMHRINEVIPFFEHNRSVKPQNQKEYKFPFEKKIIQELCHGKFYPNYKTSKSIGTRYTFGSYVRVYDFGGQESFYSAHKLFLSNFGLCVLVFNSYKFKQKDIDRLRFWCNSILQSVPNLPVLIVGTHWRKTQRSLGKLAEEEINVKLSYLIETLQENLNLIKNKKLLFFPIENSDEEGSEIKSIKQKIQDICSNGGIFLKPGFKKRLPLSQILFMDSIQQECNHILYSELKEKALSYGLTEIDFQNMIKAYRHSGLIIYFPELMKAELNFVVITPDWLSEALGRFIRDQELHNFAFMVSKEKFLEFREYVGTGLISEMLFMDLLRIYSEEERNFILEVALKTFLLIPFVSNEEKPKKQYLVSNLLPDIEDKTKFEVPTDFDIFLSSEKYLAPEDFGMLVVMIIENCSLKGSTEHKIMKKNFLRIVFPSICPISFVFYVQEKRIGVKCHNKEKINNLIVLLRNIIDKCKQRKKDLELTVDQP
eukprot:snap_masked-scaffold_1-processed-gene-12.25-mRNA-1 protein AED:1.00 eAED:1.00 QI:0/0/0/0/1/1/7/0/796